MTAGAYGATMAGTYNSRPLTPEVMVSGNEMVGSAGATAARGVDRGG